MERVSVLLLALVALVGCGSAADPGEPGLGGRTDEGRFEVRAEPQLDPMVINTMHDWLVRVSDPDGRPVTGARVVIDGDMPEHLHGLPTEPRTTGEVEPGVYRVQGMEFNMTGHWEMTFIVWSQGVTDRLTVDLHLR